LTDGQLERKLASCRAACDPRILMMNNTKRQKLHIDINEHVIHYSQNSGKYALYPHAACCATFREMPRQKFGLTHGTNDTQTSTDVQKTKFT